MTYNDLEDAIHRSFITSAFTNSVGSLNSFDLLCCPFNLSLTTEDHNTLNDNHKSALLCLLSKVNPKYLR